MTATAVAPNVPTPDERSMAMLAHILMIFTGFLGPLIIWLIKKQSKFVSFHALQALIWQIFLGVVFVFAIVFFFAGIIGAAATSQGGQPNPAAGAGFAIGMLIFWLAIMAASLGNLVLAIIYAVKANQGEWAGYPVIGNWARRIAGL